MSMGKIYKGLFPVVWIAFALYWFISALTVKKARQSESPLARLGYLALVYCTVALAVAPGLQHRYFAWTSPQETGVRFFIGAAMLLAGLGFAVWARIHLGQYWSGRVQLKEGHQLIRSGPYQLVRHPIYTGILTGFQGTSVAVGGSRSLIAFGVLVLLFLFKSRREECLMIQAFGDEYRQYRNFRRQQVK